MTKYRDPLFNEKRLWASRLLAQFLADGAIIVCVDESNIRSDSLGGKRWQFNAQSLRRPALVGSITKRAHSLGRKLDPFVVE